MSMATSQPLIVTLTVSYLIDVEPVESVAKCQKPAIQAEDNPVFVDDVRGVREETPAVPPDQEELAQQGDKTTDR